MVGFYLMLFLLWFYSTSAWAYKDNPSYTSKFVRTTNYNLPTCLEHNYLYCCVDLIWLMWYYAQTRFGMMIAYGLATILNQYIYNHHDDVCRSVHIKRHRKYSNSNKGIAAQCSFINCATFVMLHNMINETPSWSKWIRYGGGWYLGQYLAPVHRQAWWWWL